MIEDIMVFLGPKCDWCNHRQGVHDGIQNQCGAIDPVDGELCECEEFRS